MAYELIQSVRLNQDYFGHAEQCTWEFTIPAPEFLAEWPAQQFIDAHIDALAQQNSRLLEMHVYRDISPDLTTNYRVVTVATASILIWVAILSAIILLSLITIAYIIVEVKDMPVYLSLTWAVALGAVAVGVIVVASKSNENI